ncbi:lactadherin isoform X1 [Octopus sinensis]|uniref:Lactadherin isoform X1 n=1 Tax=Octopus sinensis TaxID=2607531 RepID=A0A6P7SFN6_9MOLL|nr:lactadherin isoform X1 [Octopus sinensis]
MKMDGNLYRLHRKGLYWCHRSPLKLQLGPIVHVLLFSLLGIFLPKVTAVCTMDGPLGMTTGTIKDFQIKSSNSYPQVWDKYCHEKYGRVYMPNKYGWCAKYKSPSEWLMVDLGVAAKVTGVMTQGRGDGVEWVTSFLVSYSMDSFDWNYVHDSYNNQKVFEGNIDSYSVRHSYFDQPILARYIKFHTVSWNKHPSMRVEILGCQLCKEPIGLPPYGKMSASSNLSFRRKSSCQPEDGNILSNKAWCSKKQDQNQWLQIDIGPPTLITAIITRGRADTRRKHWVTKFNVTYSNDTKIWYGYRDALHLASKNQWYWNSESHNDEGLLFRGNDDKHLKRIHYLNSPFVARFIRIHPVEWHQKIGMRFGLLGCPYTGKCTTGFMRVNDAAPCVENLAFKKESWINSKRHIKRHIRHQDKDGPAARAVDGKIKSVLPECTTLDNLYGENPVWMVDLGPRTNVSGVIIYTWQNRDDVQVQPNTNSLEKIIVYVHDKLKDSDDDQYAPDNMCGYVSALNNAIFQPKLHVQCIRSLSGRYLSIEAWGKSYTFNKLFSATFCEVQVYA